MAFGAYVVIYRIYLRSWFATQPFPQAVLPLLLINTFRYMGLAAMVPGQLEPTIPFRALQVIGWGDFAAGTSALLAAIAVHHRWTAATTLVGLFTIIGFADVIAVGYTASAAEIFESNMGTQWFVSVFYAPAFLLSQGYIAYRLVGHLRASRANSISPN